MKDISGTTHEAIEETAVLKQRIRELEQSGSAYKRAEKEIAILAEIGRVIGSSLDIDEVYEQFAVQVQKLVPFDRLSVDINDPNGASSTVTYVFGLDIPGRRKGDVFMLPGTISEAVTRTRNGLIMNMSTPEEITDRYPLLTNISTIRAGMRSLISVPLISRHEIIGVLHFRSTQPNVYTERDLNLAERIGAQIAGAIANAQLFADLKNTEESLKRAHDELEARVADRTEKLTRANQELRDEIAERKRLEKAKQREQQKTKRLAEEMAAIAEIGRVICSTMEIDEVYERFAAEARKLIRFDRITVNLCNVRENLVTVAYVSGANISSYKQGDSFRLAGTLIEEVLQKRISQIIQSEKMDEIVRRIPAFSRNLRAGLRSLIGVPLIYKDEVVGILYFWTKTPNAYTEADLRLAEEIGDQIAGAIANAQLFAELKKADLSLRESEERFRVLVEQAEVGVAEVEIGTGRFFTVNRCLCKIVGRTREELLATTFLGITHPEDLHLHEKKKALLIAGKIGHYTLEKRYMRKDGGIVWVNLTVSPLLKPGEEPRRHISVIEDITERKRAEEALHRANEELQAKNITLQELNTTLKVLLKQREDDKNDMEERFVMNVQNMVLPFVETMKKAPLNDGQQSCLEIIEAHLRDIVTPLLKKIRHFNLTPRELTVAALVKNGKTTKEIAETLRVATGSVDVHRINIRKKLGLNHRQANLRSYLETLV